GRIGRHPGPGLARRAGTAPQASSAVHPAITGSASLPGAGPGSAAKSSGGSASGTRSPPPAAETFKIEPLLRRDAPSAELAAQVALNEARASALGALILREGDVERAKAIFRERREGRAAKVRPRRPLSDCPPVPPNLVGLLDINLNHSSSSGPLQASLSASSWWSALGSGGSWRPLDCTARHIVAIVIPYRDRWQHLLTLLSYLHPILQRQQVAYRVFVVEQYGNDTFNKGAIMNAAFRVVLQNAGTMARWSSPSAGGGARVAPAASFYHCFVFHDVDLIPEDDRNMYTCPEHPRHMSVAVDELNYRLPYKVLVGGVFAIRTEHFFRVNGYSNLYWGWGGEDDDMGYRVQQAGLVITRPPEWIARYTMIKHVKRRPLAWRVRNKLLRTSGRRYRLDGLNTANYRLLAISEHHLFTRLLVDVGVPPANIRAIQAQADAPASTTPPPSAPSPPTDKS
ncbi:beta-1,4-N-acetylgalactosaminyltransferase bre-4-like, partial [Ischnura elegans]|uniref:beta-1,4-N-acetylgalactosaminyltransferase bre-4-like n=1 Tax=Ischnura elegans TaxID=197161 RepID=UPI001ED8842F